ncbi:hypothetical protein SAMN04487946_105222 [Halobellus clavatus]|jgi:hypothetical protein|uniref:Uncharacterized protein n=1 Tax=Halobellus clavatus TaxID=660517 RepID=A0A1H3GK84_9EURY|nr:hypothetical protein SAMN04487946_105222 [Halobellus clavatus]
MDLREMITQPSFRLDLPPTFGTAIAVFSLRQRLTVSEFEMDPLACLSAKSPFRISERTGTRYGR